MKFNLRGFLFLTAGLMAGGLLDGLPSGRAHAAEAEERPSELPVRPGQEAPGPAPKRRALSESGQFALTFPASDWFVVPGDEDEQKRRYDLTLRHRDGASFVRAHRARRDNRGIEGSLIKESEQAKYLIQYDPETVAPEVSTEDYEASALFCGRRRQGPARRACSLVKVVLHGREVIRIHSLIDADTPRARKRLQTQVEAIVESLERLEPGNGPL